MIKHKVIFVFFFISILSLKLKADNNLTKLDSLIIDLKSKIKDYPNKSDYFAHDKETDTLFCPSGKPMHNVGTHNRKNKSGQVQHITSYRAINCSGCPLKDKCYKSKGNRRVDVNHTLKDYKEKVKQLLKSEQGIYHRKKRAYDVEPVFANIKHNKNFKRFNLRGIKKVEIETGLIALAHNFKKMAA